MDETRLTVLKIGGGAGVDWAAACTDSAGWASEGRPLIVVHGASQRADEMGRQLGHEPRQLRFASGHVSRYNDPRTREIFVRAALEVNQQIEVALSQRGAAGAGMTGDRTCLHGSRKGLLRAYLGGRQLVIRDDYSGQLERIDRQALWAELDRGRIPVIPPLVASEGDGLLNIDGDSAAAAIAAELGAARLVILSNVPGLLRTYPQENSLVERVPRSQLGQAHEWAQGRMKRKVASIARALEAGVAQAVVADGRQAQPLSRALAGGGTWFEGQAA